MREVAPLRYQKKQARHEVHTLAVAWGFSVLVASEVWEMSAVEIWNFRILKAIYC